MKILVAEDDRTTRHLLEHLLANWGYSVLSVADGTQAWDELQKTDAPPLAILDWMMPGLDGLEICRRVRAAGRSSPMYLLLLTARSEKENVVEGLEAGANDYLSKPYDVNELRARVQVGERMVTLQLELAERVREVEAAMAQITQLQGLLPICAYCKKIRDDKNYWHEVESYIKRHADVRFSHGVCPECFEKVVKVEIEGAQRSKEAGKRKDG